GHHIGDATTSLHWSQVCNDLIHRVCTLFPQNFVGVCQLPQTPGVPPANCIPELERCIKELGFIGCNLNPDPSGGYWKDPPLTDEFFDTCVYTQPGIDLLFKVIPADNILFASEMVGAVRGIDPETGNYYDDTKRYVDAVRISDEDRRKVYEGNARRIYSRLKNKIPASR